MNMKNKVIAGDYAGANVTLVNEQVTLAISLGHMIILNKKMVVNHVIESEVKNNHKVAITFADGKKSLLQLDDKMCKSLLVQLF
ncbi:MAG: hypothetical protein IKU21_00285 [Anaerotignum sp.]|nr:hypothetical protein [Anaerotignum sp.]